MLIIRKEQMDAFASTREEKFIDEMVNHVREYFPNHFRVITELQIRRFIRFAIEKARKLGFESERNVCMYLNCMLILGSNFDCDPQYPWAHGILTGNGKGPDAVMDALSDKTLDVFYSFAGEDLSHLKRALLRAHSQFDSLIPGAIAEDLMQDIHTRLKNLYPQKYLAIGEEAVSRLVESSIKSARSYEIYSEGNQLQYSFLSFLIGCGFDTDPQFPWAHKILTGNEAAPENEKMDLLCRQAKLLLEEFIVQK
jgi:hypothetical protein